MTTERRSYRLDAPELRADDGDAPSLVGYAAVFDQYSQNLGGFVEVVRRDAFSNVLGQANGIVGLFNHNPDKLLGTVASNTLTIEADERGLRYQIDLDPSDPDAQSVMAKARTGKLRGSSFSFGVDQRGATWGKTEQGFPLRELRSFAFVRDVGPVTHPAYLGTEEGDLAVSLRSLADTTGREMTELIEAAKAGDLAACLEARDAGDESTADAEGEQPRPRPVSRWTAPSRNH